MFKKFISITISLMIVLAFTSCGDSWVAKINGEKLTLDDFNKYYYANHTLIYKKDTAAIDVLAADTEEVQKNPYLIKTKFLEQLIRQKLVSQMIDNEKILEEDPDYAIFVYFQHLTIIVNKYSELKFKDKIEVTPADIDKEYQSNKAYYEQVPLEQAEKYIRQKIQYSKLEELSLEVVSQLQAKHKIVRNEDLIKKVISADKSKHPKEGTLLTIDDEVILTADKFQSLYYIQHTTNYDISRDEVDKLAENEQAMQQNPLLNRQLFFEQLVRMILFYDEALNGEEFSLKDDQNIKYMLIIQEDIMKVGYYLKKKYTKELEPSAAEIDKAYEANKERFKDAPIDKVGEYLKRQLLTQKLQQKGAEIVQQAKEQSIIEYNLKTLSDEKKNEPKK